MKTILFFGDSLTAGYGLANVSLESLPALLQDELNKEKLNYKVVNAGVSGETTSGGLARIDLFLNQPIDVFVLELGANDVLRGMSPKKTFENLQGIIDKVYRASPGVKMLLLGMEIPAWIPGNFVASFRLIFRDIAKINNMALVPFLLDGIAGVPHLNLKDGFHPSAEGYRLISKQVWPILKHLIAG